jgi:hypothetical protein
MGGEVMILLIIGGSALLLMFGSAIFISWGRL